MVGIVVVGLGAIGRSVAEAILDRPRVAQLCGVVDSNPALTGRDVAEVLGKTTARAMRIVGTIQEAKKAAGDVQVAIVTTGSRFKDVRGTLEQCADTGWHVVSSCEELAYPALRNPQGAAEVDQYARTKGVAILGTGVNPGFAMDAFALTVSAAVTKVTSVTCVRSLDAMHRRYQLQKKVAAGMTVEQFQTELANKRIGHVGCAESAALIAAGLGWRLEQVDERFEPVIAAEAIANEHFKIEPGQVRGMRMLATGTVAGRKAIELDLTMAFKAETFDEVRIEGERPVHVRATTGFPGDVSTVAMLVNCAQAVRGLEPGLRTMLEMLPLRAVGV